MNRNYLSGSAALLFTAMIPCLGKTGQLRNSTSKFANDAAIQPKRRGLLGGRGTPAFSKRRLVMKFSRTPDGKLTGLLDSLDQRANDILMSLVTFQNGALHVENEDSGRDLRWQAQRRRNVTG